MTKNGKPETVAELRETLQRLSEERDRYLATIAEAELGIKECARAIFDGDDGEAAEKRKGHKMRRNGARDAVEQIEMILPDLQRELAEAIAKEDQERREADAAEAKAFAIKLGGVFSQVDARLAEFRSAYTTAVAAVRQGRLHGWNLPSEELMQAKLNRALQTTFTVDELRAFDMPPLPAPQRTTFAEVGAAYGRAVEGGALHMVKPPAPPPPPPPQQTTAKPDNNKMPKQVDIGARLPGDGPDFQVKMPAAR